MKVVANVTLNRFPELTAEMKLNAQVTVRKTAETIGQDIKDRIQSGPKSGRIYKRGSKTHQASAPGQAPASDYGKLWGSVQVTDEELRSVVHSNSEYSPHLEFGTVKMAARPAWIPASIDAWPDFLLDMMDILKG